MAISERFNRPKRDGCEVRDLQELIDRGERFATIYADPPWPYSNQGTRAATNGEYKTASLEFICGLPVKQLAEDDAHLHLWTTSGFLFEAKQVIEAWGFEYKSCFVWVKEQLGIGNYWRLSHEIMLLGVRGNLPFEDKGLCSWICKPRGEHSAKPDEIRRLIEKASPPERLELFARHIPDGWKAWGDEIRRTMFESQLG